MQMLVAVLHKPLAVGWQSWRRLRQGLRFALILSWISCGLLALILLRLLLPWRPVERCLQPLMPTWMRVACLFIGVGISRAGALPAAGSLLLSNHVSWLDIVVIGAQLPVRFVAKSEVRHWPIIGLLAASAGTIFLQRGKRTGDDSSEQIRSQIQQLLNAGETVLLFPEGTTGCGGELRHFHSRLLPADKAVVPLALAYRGRGAAAVPFVGRDTFAGSLWRILAEHDLHAHIQLLPAISGNPKQQASAAQCAVAAVLYPKPTVEL